MITLTLVIILSPHGTDHRWLVTSPLDCRGATTRCQLVSDWQWVAMWQYWQYWQSMARPDQVMRSSPGPGTSTGHGQPPPLLSSQSTLRGRAPASLSLGWLSPGPGSLKYVTRGAGAGVTVGTVLLRAHVPCHDAWTWQWGSWPLASIMMVSSLMPGCL